MAAKLHVQLVKETARMQERVVLMRALQKEFGDNALLDEPWMTSRKVLTDSTGEFARVIAGDLERIAENLETIRELEALFAEKEKIDLEALVDYIRRRNRVAK